MSPPVALSRNLLTSAAGRREVKAARRDVLLQCDRCSFKATARLNGFGRLSMINAPAQQLRNGKWSHRDCGGLLVPFDMGSS